MFESGVAAASTKLHETRIDLRGIGKSKYKDCERKLSYVKLCRSLAESQLERSWQINVSPASNATQQASNHFSHGLTPYRSVAAPANQDFLTDEQLRRKGLKIVSRILLPLP